MNVACRCLSTSTQLQRMRIIAPIVNKVFNFETKKKKKRGHSKDDAPANTWQFEQRKIITPTKRIAALNRILMRTITDLMATGEFAPQLAGKGIEISRINITSQFNILNVYYFTQHENEDEIQEILNASAGYLRHQLAQLQIMTSAPLINFIKDKSLYAQKKIENILSNLKIEEEYETNNNEEPNDDSVLVEDEYKIEVPEMKHNVLGFNHSFVMKKITSSLKKINNHETEENQSLPELSPEQQRVQLEDNNYLTTAERSKFFDDFLKETKIKRKKEFSLRIKKQIEQVNEDSTDDEEERDYTDKDDIDIEHRDYYEHVNKRDWGR